MQKPQVQGGVHFSDFHAPPCADFCSFLSAIDFGAPLVCLARLPSFSNFKLACPLCPPRLHRAHTTPVPRPRHTQIWPFKNTLLSRRHQRVPRLVHGGCVGELGYERRSAEALGISWELGTDGYCFFIRPGELGQGGIDFDKMLKFNGFFFLLFVNLILPWSKYPVSSEEWQGENQLFPCFTLWSLSQVDLQQAELRRFCKAAKYVVTWSIKSTHFLAKVFGWYSIKVDCTLGTVTIFRVDKSGGIY